MQQDLAFINAKNKAFKHMFRQEVVLIDFLNSFFDYIGYERRVVKAELPQNKDVLDDDLIFPKEVLAYLDNNEVILIKFNYLVNQLLKLTNLDGNTK